MWGDYIEFDFCSRVAAFRRRSATWSTWTWPTGGFRRMQRRRAAICTSATAICGGTKKAFCATTATRAKMATSEPWRRNGCASALSSSPFLCYSPPRISCSLSLQCGINMEWSLTRLNWIKLNWIGNIYIKCNSQIALLARPQQGFVCSDLLFRSAACLLSVPLHFTS